LIAPLLIALLAPMFVVPVAGLDGPVCVRMPPSAVTEARGSHPASFVAVIAAFVVIVPSDE
jgi:hypothetical protein